MKFGARIFKTGIAITLSLYLTMLLQLDQPAIAAIAAIFAVQPSIYRSYQSIVAQIQANVIGAFFAIVVAVTIDNNPVIIGLVVVLVIAINLKLKIENTIPLAVVTVIIIMAKEPNIPFFQFALERFSLVMLGVFSSFVVNLIFMPPKHETKLHEKISKQTEQVTKWIRIIARRGATHSTLKDDLNTFKDELIKMDQMYLFYKEERNYTKQDRYAKARKLVLFRQMIGTVNQAVEILKALDRYEYEFEQMPVELQQLVQQQLYDLTTYHEHLLFEAIGKTRPDGVDNETTDNNKSLFELFMASYEKSEGNYEHWIHVLPVIALITDYSRRLEHLDKLIASQQTYHQEDSKKTSR